MKITVNIRHLEGNGLRLVDKVSAEDIGLESRDELIHFKEAVAYDLEIQILEEAVLVQGHVSVGLRCECARCLRSFDTKVEIVDWAAHLPLSGEEAVPVDNDCVDLTPLIREDIFLALPQHPLCSRDCPGLLRESGRQAKELDDSALRVDGSSAWADLDKLNL
jgi:uncharacterized protein